MPRRYLFGPVRPGFVEENLRGHVEAGNCLPFGPGDTWAAIEARLPVGWRPDFVVLDLHYASVPPTFWSAPVPLVGLAIDWNLLWHYYRRHLPSCDLVLTDPAGVEALARQGIRHACAANLFGCGRSFLEITHAPVRDIDVLFVGNVNPAVQRERLPWLGRLSRLADRWRVEVRTNVYGEEYRRLLARARVVFNRSIRGECNMRAFEAAAAGALLFQEADNHEVPAFFTPEKEYIPYTEENLEALLECYLSDEDRRREVAAAARARVGKYSFERLWAGHLERVEERWPAIQERLARRLERGDRPDLLTDTWELLGANAPDAGRLIPALEAGASADPHSADLHNALGLAAGLPKRGGAEAARRGLDHFRRAAVADPTHAVAVLNHVEALVATGQDAEAVEQARRQLGLLDWQLARNPPALDAPHFPPVFDHFRVEWERAAWGNAGDPAGEARAKRALLRWRLHSILACLTGELAHAHEAALARPDLPPSRAELGRALVRAGRPADAAEHLRLAVAGNPFDGAAARDLHRVLGEAGDAPGQDRLAHERRLLSRCAPQLVPAEPWFERVPLFPSTVPPPPAPLRIIWEGPQRVLHSLALVNREVCARLIRRGHEVSVLPGESPRPGAIDAHVRQTWPPDFSRPAGGPFVVMQPWEYGSLPRAWADAVTRQADEVWAYTRHVLRSYVESGVPAERVHLVPLGVDPARFHLGVPPLRLGTRRRFKFLFVVGTIHRKGFDLLLEAYGRAFSARDDVCLVVKDLGRGSFYRGQTGEGLIARFRARPGAPEVEDVERELGEEEMAGLYRACDCLVHPYRGEGFGLPVAEAMACRLPVVVTGYGAALDYCNEGNAYLVPAKVVRLPRKQVGELETVDYPWLAEPDREVLAYLMRRVVERPEEARARGEAGRAYVHAQLTWEHTAAAVERRILALGRQSPAGVTAPVGTAGEGTAPEPPTGRELASVIVLCPGPAEHTRLCLEAVLRHTRQPFELLVIDRDGSGLPEGLSREQEPVRVVVFRPEPSESAAGAWNRALAEARGRYLVLLDGGVVVTEGWLDCLVKAALHQWPQVGLAGPVSAGLPAPQGVGAGPADLSGLSDFAVRRRQEYRGRGQFVERLADFCVLVRREVLERVGGLGEGPFPDELCRRAAGAGFRLLVALDVYVHRLAGPPRRQRVSLCIIVKDEAERLPRCLGSVAELVDEVVVVDTGSADDTRAVADRLGARGVEFAWVDDFSAARNESIRQATGEWIFWLDGDEWLDEDNRGKLRALFAGLTDEKAAYVMRQFSEAADGSGSAMAVDQVRLFRRDPAVRWEYRVHEQVLLSLRRAGHDVRWTDVRISHSGYQDAGASGAKLERNLRLLRLEQAERPGDPVTLYHLGLALGQQGKMEEALALLRESLARTPADYSNRPKLHAMIGRGLQRLGRRDEALSACRAGLAEHPGDVELLFLEGLLLFEAGDLAGAEGALGRLLNQPRRERFVTMDAGLGSYKARHLLGEVHRRRGRPAEAEAQWREAVRHHAGFAAGWQSLGELYLGQARWAELEEVLARLRPLWAVAAGLLRARMHLAREEPGGAKSALEAVLALAPGHAEATRLLSGLVGRRGKGGAGQGEGEEKG
jgi:glycosyltransferase involved in cell wall biosynthesis